MKKLLFLFIAILTNNFVSAQWVNIDPQVNNGVEFRSIHFTSSNVGYVVGTDNNGGLLLKTTDGGTTWTKHSTNILPRLQSVHFISADTGFVAGKETFGRAIYLKTIDAGLNWDTLSFGQDYFPAIENLHFVNGLTGFSSYSNASRGQGTVYKTVDGGYTWNRIWNSDDNDSGFGVHFINPNVGYIVRGHICAAIVKTTNGGSGWNTQHGGIIWNNKPNLSFNPLNDVYMIDPNTAWAVGDSGVILNTTNGYNWYQQTSGTTEKLNDVFFVDANTGIAVGDNGTIIKTNNGGQQWFTQNSITTSNIESVHFVDVNIGHCAGENKTVRRTIDGGGAGSPLGIKNINEIELTIFPNPSEGTLYIKSKSKILNIRLDNLLGQTVYSQPFNGTNGNIDNSRNSSGIYIMTINTLKGIVTRKVELK